MAGLFLAMAGLAYALAATGSDRRRARIDGAAIAVAAFIPPAFLSLAFPEGGWAPFPFTAYLPIPIFSLVCLALLPRSERALRWGVALYGLGSTFAIIVLTPMGGNAVRLGALFGGPVLLMAIWGKPWTRSRAAAIPAGGRLLAPGRLAVVARRARRHQVHRGPRREVRLLRAPAPVPGHAPRPAPDRGAVHAQPLGGRGGGRGDAAGARLAAPARHRSQRPLLRGPPHEPDATPAGWPRTRSATWPCRAPSRTRAPTRSAR